MKSGAEWYAASKVTGIRQIWVDGDKKAIEDKDAPPLWGRFYDIETNRPIFSGRDGVKKFSMNEIEARTPRQLPLVRRRRPGGGRKLRKVEGKMAQAGAPEIETQIKEQIEKADAVVAADGSGRFKTVQEAVDAAPTGLSKPYVIFVKKGFYKGPLTIPAEKPFIHLVGEDWDTTVLTGDLNARLPGEDGKPIGTFKTASTVIAGDDFRAENIAFENSFGLGSQALAMQTTGDRGVYKHCRFLGWQDTILVNAGRHYFDDCYIAGHVDFIFGAGTVFFDKCLIHCRAKGYITAASTPEDQPFGYVFSNCRITAEPDAKKSFLGRPWRPFAAVAFLNTDMADAIEPAGWNNWRDPAREKTARYAEYNSTGPGANPEARVSWSKQLTDDQAKTYTVDKVLAGQDGWKPQ